MDILCAYHVHPLKIAVRNLKCILRLPGLKDPRKDSLPSVNSHNIWHSFIFVALKKAVWSHLSDSFWAGIFGDSLCTFADSMLGKFARKQKTYRCLNFPRWNGLLPVLGAKSLAFAGYLFKDIIYKWVHDGHRLTWDANIGMDLLKHIVNVPSIGFFPLFWSLVGLFWELPLWALLRTFLRALGRAFLRWTGLTTGTHLTRDLSITELTWNNGTLKI